MKTKLFLITICAILLVALQSCSTANKLSKPTVVSDKSIKKYPSLIRRMKNIQFYNSGQIILSKPFSMKQDTVIDGRLIIKAISRDDYKTIPKRTKGKVISLVTEKRTSYNKKIPFVRELVKVSFDANDTTLTVLYLKNKRGVYKVTGTETTNPYKVLKGIDKVKLLFDPDESMDHKVNSGEAIGNEVK